MQEALLTKPATLERIPGSKRRSERRPRVSDTVQLALLRELPGTIRRRREALGWSQYELACRTKVAEITIQSIERGKRLPSMAMIDVLFSTLGLNLQLIEETTP